jgi:hypothetical protein
MARGALHSFSLARRSKKQREAARLVGLANIQALLAVEPLTAAELADQLVIPRATVFGYLRVLHKNERVVLPLIETRDRAVLWALGTDLTLPPPAEASEQGFVPKRPRVKATQIGMHRHWMDVALFGPANA